MQPEHNQPCSYYKIYANFDSIPDYILRDENTMCVRRNRYDGDAFINYVRIFIVNSSKQDLLLDDIIVLINPTAELKTYLTLCCISYVLFIGEYSARVLTDIHRTGKYIEWRDTWNKM